jgi:hypothetical protein
LLQKIEPVFNKMFVRNEDPLDVVEREPIRRPEEVFAHTSPPTMHNCKTSERPCRACLAPIVALEAERRPSTIDSLETTESLAIPLPHPIPAPADPKDLTSQATIAILSTHDRFLALSVAPAPYSPQTSNRPFVTTTLATVEPRSTHNPSRSR